MILIEGRGVLAMTTILGSVGKARDPCTFSAGYGMSNPFISFYGHHRPIVKTFFLTWYQSVPCLFKNWTVIAAFENKFFLSGRTDLRV